MRDAQYLIIDDKEGFPLVIQDIGPWDEYLTVTNDAERVVDVLFKEGRLPEGRRLFYFDSEEGSEKLDELLIKDGKFAGFRVGQE